MVFKTVTYILLLTASFSNPLFCQLLKLPVFFEHYVEHKQINAEVDLLDFLSMHYYGVDLNDNDENRDMQLPFKKLEVSLAPFMFHSPVRSYQLSAPTPAPASNYVDHNVSFFPAPYCGSLFRPPQV